MMVSRQRRKTILAQESMASRQVHLTYPLRFRCNDQGASRTWAQR